MVKGMVMVFGLVIITFVVLFALWTFFNMLLGIEKVRSKWHHLRHRGTKS